MTKLDIIVTISGFIGALASILGAWLSITSAKKAKTSAEIADKAKLDLIKKQTNSKLSSLLSDGKRVQNSFVKYRLPFKTRTLDGINHEQDAEELQTFLLKLNEFKSRLDEIPNFKFSNFYRRINTSLDSFTNTVLDEEIKSYGVTIFKNLDEIISILRRQIDNFNQE